MNSQTGMYELKVIIQLPDPIIHNQIMYKMKNIHDNEKSTEQTNIIEQVIKFLKKPLPEYVALEARQEKILQQLSELREQVSTLCSYLNCDETKSIVLDVIINVNPKWAPYSLLALSECWKDVHFKIQNYIHSSINERVPDNFNKSTGSSTLDRQVNFSIIWKNVEDLEFIVDLNHRPLRGEANLLRYLDRILNSHRNYENSLDTNRIDKILDLCSAFASNESQEKIKDMLSPIGDELILKQSKQHDIADLAVWSIVRNLSTVPHNLKQWYSNCNKVFA